MSNQESSLYRSVEQDIRRLEKEAEKVYKKERPVVLEALRKILSYAIEGLALSAAMSVIPAIARGDSWNWEKVRAIIAVGLVAAAVFALLDTYAPRIGGASRIGAGIAIGAIQVGGLPFTRTS